MSQWYWCRRDNDFSAKAKWRVIATRLGMPAFQIIALVNRLDEIANAAEQRGQQRGTVADYPFEELAIELGMPAQQAMQIFTALAEGDSPWIVAGRIAGFIERNTRKEDRTAALRDRRRNTREAVRKDLVRLVEHGLISPVRRAEIEATLTALPDEELFELPAQLGREAFRGEPSHATHAVGSVAHGVGSVGHGVSHAKERDREESRETHEIHDGDGARLREERPNVPLISQQAFTLADDYRNAARVDPDDHRWMGLPYQAQVWIDRGYDRGLLLTVAADIAARKGDKPLVYHQTAIENAHTEAARRASAPRLPLVQVVPGAQEQQHAAKTSGPGDWRGRRDAAHAARAELHASVVATASGRKGAAGGGQGGG
jgi:hypothetical protein